MVEDKAQRQRLREIQEFLKSRPQDNFKAEYSKLVAFERQVREEIAYRLEKPLNAELQRHPQATLEDKRELCRWLNGELRALNLAIRCPKTNLPAIIVAASGSQAGGRFRWKVTTPDGAVHNPFSTPGSITVELMPDSPRREPFAEYWAAQARQERKRDSRER